MDTESLLPFAGLLGVPVITGLVQLFKPFIADTRYHPLLAVLMGIVINMAISFTLVGIQASTSLVALLQGIVAGLAASGLYDAGRSIIGK